MGLEIQQLATQQVLRNMKDRITRLVQIKYETPTIKENKGSVESTPRRACKYKSEVLRSMIPDDKSSRRVRRKKLENG